MAEVEKFVANHWEAAPSLGVIRTYGGMFGGKPDWLKASLYPQSSTPSRLHSPTSVPLRASSPLLRRKEGKKAVDGAVMAVPLHVSGVSPISFSSRRPEHRAMLLSTTLTAAVRRISLWTLN
jgi:hypothetical protein